MATGSHSQYDPSEDDAKSSSGAARRKDFDCPECSANNPYDDGINPGDEVRCYYCGAEFTAELTESGKWRFRDL